MTESRLSLRPSPEDDAAEARRRALRELPTETRDDAAVEALGDVDWRVRQEAVEMLRRATPTEALLERLVAAIAQAENVGRRNAALEVAASLGPVAVDRLRRALREERSGVRKFFAEALGAAGDVSSAPELAALTADPDPNVAAAALEALVALGGPHAERVLRERLARTLPFERVAALDGLVRLRARLSWEELAPLVEDRVLRRAALALFGRCGDTRALGVLAEALSEGGRSATVAITALVELADSVGPTALRAIPSSVLPALGAAMRDGDRTARRDAAALVFAMRDESWLTDALDAAADDVLTDLGAAALRRWGTDAVTPVLRASRRCVGLGRSLALGLAAELLAPGADADDDERTAQRAELLVDLREALDEGAPSLRSAAIRGLASFGGSADVAPLVMVLADEPSELSDLAAEALRAIAIRAPHAVDAALHESVLRSPASIALFAHRRGTSAIDALRAQLSAPRVELRVAAAQALGTLVDGRARDDLAFALADEDERVRLAAVESLARFQEASVGQVLLEGLEAASPPVQAAMARALARLGATEAIPMLRSLLDASAPVAAAAIEALGVLGSPELEEDVSHALEHSDPEVAHAAVLVAARLSFELARPLRERALTHEAWHVRRAAVRALAKDPGARASLGRALETDDDPMVRESLLEALAEWNDAEKADTAKTDTEHSR